MKIFRDFLPFWPAPFLFPSHPSFSLSVAFHPRSSVHLDITPVLSSVHLRLRRKNECISCRKRQLDVNCRRRCIRTAAVSIFRRPCARAFPLRALYSGGNCAEFQPLKCAGGKKGRRRGGENGGESASRNARKSSYLKVRSRRRCNGGAYRRRRHRLHTPMNASRIAVA